MIPQNQVPLGAGMIMLRRWQAERCVEAENVAAATLRAALPADPLQSPPPALAPAPDGGIVGRVDDLRFRLSWRMLGPVLIATLTIGRWEQDGTPLPKLVVEMRGGYLKGVLMPGDWVQLPKYSDPRQPLRELANLTNGVRVEMARKRVKRIPGDLMPVFHA